MTPKHPRFPQCPICKWWAPNKAGEKVCEAADIIADKFRLTYKVGQSLHQKGHCECFRKRKNNACKVAGLGL